MTATTAIANHLQIAADLIQEIQEWASVLWVRIQGMRPRFVSKKVTKENNMTTDLTDLVAAINTELARLIPGEGKESLYGTYVKIESADGKDYIRLEGYCGSDNGYLNGSATLEALRSIDTAEINSVFPTWLRGKIVSQKWVWGPTPQYIQDFYRALNTPTVEYI